MPWFVSAHKIPRVSEKHPIRNGVISTVIGGVILGALGVAWPPAAHVLGAVWHVLLGSVPIPVWSLGLAGITLVALLATTLRRPSGPSRSPDLPLSASSLRSEQLTAPSPSAELETKILQRLVKEDGAPVSVAALLRATRATKLRLQAALESLESMNVVEMSGDPEGGDVDVSLTSQGLQYVVQRGLA